MVFKKIVKFLGCFIVQIRDFIKKLRYLKSKISTKFHCLLFLFYFFSIFVILFFISPIQTCPKIMECFVVFYWKGSRFYQRFLENSKSYFQKNVDMLNIFVSKFCGFTIFFYFFIIFDILFSITCVCTYQKSVEIFMFFYFMD